jgi:glycosyltransferase involved in cell wall biosynthesis
MINRVVHLTSVHYAFDTRIYHRECKSLALAGYDVTLIAPRADGDLSIDGVKMRAITPPRNRRERIIRTIWAVYWAAVKEDADLYHFHDPELLLIGVLLKLQGKKVIYDVHEDYRGIMGVKQWLPWGMHKPASIAARICETILSRACDRVIAATPVIARIFRPEQTRLVQNYPWLYELSTPDSLPYDKREAIVAYVGWLDDTRGMREMARAVELAAREMPVKLVLGGKVQDGASSNFEKDGPSELVEYLGFLSRPQVKKLIASARIGIVTFLSSVNYDESQPTKLFEYMSGSLPVIASDFPVYRRIVESAKCGLLVDPRNPAAIADAILWLMRNPLEAAEMGRNGRRAVAEKYNWEREADSLLATYAELQTCH